MKRSLIVRALAMVAGLGSTIIATTAAPAAELDFTGDVLRYFELTSVDNRLGIVVIGTTYTITDEATPAINLSAAAATAGCSHVDPNTVTCPAAAIGSFDLRPGLGNDLVDVTGADDPAARALEALEPVDDIHATADYRAHLVRVLTTRVLARAKEMTHE